MLVYIVEDDPLKLSRLMAFIAEEFREIAVETFASFQSGLKAVERRLPDLLILDMTLPTFDRVPGSRESRNRNLGGYELMRKLRLRNISFKAIVLTQLESFGEPDDQVSFEQITERCKSEFRDNFVGSVYFRQSGVLWKHELSDLIRLVLKGGAQI